MFLLSGPPGSGKTTQSRLLVGRCQFLWLGVGRLLADKYPPGTAIRKEMDAGRIVDHRVVDNLVYSFLDDLSKAERNRVVVDGYPRTVEQTASFLYKYGAEVGCYWLLEASQEMVQERLRSRQRSDDGPSKVGRRFCLHQEITPKIVEAVQRRDIPIRKLDASQPTMLIHQQLVRSIERHQGQTERPRNSRKVSSGHHRGRPRGEPQGGFSI